MRTLEEWKFLCNKIHNYKYEYIEKYKKNNYHFLKIKCKKHGIFEKRTTNHITNKQGCPKCSKQFKYTIDDFIKKSNQIHNNKYDYSNTKYKNTTTKIIITCPIHGDFLKTPKNHFKGQGCSQCTRCNHTTKTYIDKAKIIHNNKYNYSKVKYINHKTKIIIICKKHGDFLQGPREHLSGNELMI